jgi:hypothetical protein
VCAKKELKYLLEAIAMSSYVLVGTISIHMTDTFQLFSAKKMTDDTGAF